MIRDLEIFYKNRGFWVEVMFYKYVEVKIARWNFRKYDVAKEK
jgi:hypothetical protein